MLGLADAAPPPADYVPDDGRLCRPGRRRTEAVAARPPVDACLFQGLLKFLPGQSDFTFQVFVD